MNPKLISVLLSGVLCALPVTAKALTFQFIAGLNGASEVPFNNATATGLAALSYNDNNSISTTDDTYSFSLSAFGLTGAATAMHIHAPAAPGFTAPPVVNLGASPFLSLNVGGTLLLGGVNVTPPNATFLSQLQAGLTYVNVHTAAFTGGEIRGQLIPVAAVPEPSTYAMLLTGLALIGWSTRRHAKASN